MLRCFMYSRFFFLRKCTLLSFFAGLFVWGNIVPVFHSVWLLKKKKNSLFSSWVFCGQEIFSIWVFVCPSIIYTNSPPPALTVAYKVTRPAVHNYNLRSRKMFTCQAVWFVRKRVGKKMKMSFSLILRLFIIWVWKKMNLRGRGKIFFFSQIFYWHWFRNLCGFFFSEKKKW